MTIYIDNEVHYTTGSTKFFIDILKLAFNDLNIITNGSWVNQIDSTIERMIFFQEFPDLKYYPKIKSKNVILIPMWDACSNLRKNEWWEFKKFKFISFSENLTNILSDLNFNYLNIKYFPIIHAKKTHMNKIPEIFFWERENGFTIDELLAILPPNEKFKIHYRGTDKKNITLKNNIEIINIPWFDKKEQLWDYMSHCDLYVAPRNLEGIGMSFLEAMSIGLVVIAKDLPTMNEYVTIENGYLINSQTDSIDLSISTITKKWEVLKKDIKRFERLYEDSDKKIVSFINSNIKESPKNIFLDFFVGFKKFIRKTKYGPI